MNLTSFMSNTEHLYNMLAEKLANITPPNSQESLLSARAVDSIVVRDQRIAISWVATDLMPQDFVSQTSAEIERYISVQFPEFHVRVIAAYGKEPAQKQEKPILTKPRLPWLRSAEIIAVGAGKGGVGKSSITYALAKSLRLEDQNLRIGVLDADIYGPSLPTLLENDGATSTQSIRGSILEHHGIHYVSFGFTTQEDEAAVWRGPMTHKALQFLTHDINWPELDILLIDLPPGTGDVPISLHKLLTIDSAILVTTPHVLSHADTIRARDMFARLNINVTACVRNMTHVSCSSCHTKIDLFHSTQAKSKTTEHINLHTFDLAYTSAPLSLKLPQLAALILDKRKNSKRA